MPRVKIPRKSTSIDMTAMCDVAFLLLTFFILTAKPKVEDPVPVDTPGSASQVLLPESDIATLTIGGKGKVFFASRYASSCFSVWARDINLLLHLKRLSVLR
jgi:biopolymer transport protein ExbD